MNPTETQTLTSGRARGKVSRLPKETRDQINQWLLDGLPYSDIIQRLDQLGHHFTTDNISQWKKRGYQDWLMEQNFISAIRPRQENVGELSENFDATQVVHAALQVGTLQIFDALRELTMTSSAFTAGHTAQEPSPAAETDGSPSAPHAPCPPDDPELPAASEETNASPADRQPSLEPNAAEPPSAPAPEERAAERRPPARPKSRLDARLGGDSAAFVRLIHALTRASRETMMLQKYRDICAQARAALAPLKDPNRKLEETETRAIVLLVDKLLGLNHGLDLSQFCKVTLPTLTQPAPCPNTNPNPQP
jgi:hypothetical protein